MARRVDPALTRRALRALAKAAQAAESAGKGLTDWERDFLASVKDRLKLYGSAFADPDKGQTGSPLSLRQGLKVRQIRKKADAPPPADAAARTHARKTGPLVAKAGKPAARKAGLARSSGLKATAFKPGRPWRRKPKAPANRQTEGPPASED